MGSMWIIGTVVLIYELRHHMINFKTHRTLYNFLAVLFTLLMGLVFLYFGTIKTFVFDKSQGTLTVKKRNTFCDRRKIVTYRLRDISDVRAVYRGYKSGAVDTRAYYIIVEFSSNRFAPDNDERFVSSSSDEEFEKEK